MANETDYIKTAEDRILLHKKNLYEQNFKEKPIQTERSNPFVYQSIICMFIFISILILKLANLSGTNEMLSHLKAQLVRDDSAQILSYVENSENQFDVKTLFENEFVNPTNVVDANTSLEPVDDSESSNEEIDTTLIPKTEFTIDNDMLEEISKTNDDLLEKK